MAYLKSLDIGYGYTADGGKTFPFRGQGVGLMPTLDEVLTHFPGRRFLINVKSNDPEEGHELAARLGKLPAKRLALISVYGGDAPIAAIEAALPAVHTMSKASLESCLLRYVMLGWSGYVPAACKATVLMIPTNIAPWLWGWPDRFLDRIDSAGSTVFLVGPWSGGFTEGLDTPEQIDALPPGYSGGISTDALDIIKPALRRRSRQ